jgi:hypothetical protein
MPIRRLLALAAVAAITAGALSGCGGESDRERAAATAAERFGAAVRDGDGAAACAVLAPKTVAELEESGSSDCADAVLDEDLPDPGPVRTTDVYGQWARVVSAEDTEFLAVFPGGWRVVAAGCRPAGEAPYDCVIGGG